MPDDATATEPVIEVVAEVSGVSLDDAQVRVMLVRRGCLGPPPPSFSHVGILLFLCPRPSVHPPMSLDDDAQSGDFEDTFEHAVADMLDVPPEQVRCTAFLRSVDFRWIFFSLSRIALRQRTNLFAAL